MKIQLEYVAAFGTSALLALFAHAARAQTGVVCTTTSESPARNDCATPLTAAPGGGSFPGSFIVPGSETSFAVHGFIQFDAVHDFGPHGGPLSANGLTAEALEGPGVSAAELAAHTSNGGTAMSVNDTRLNIETRTPTAYGEIKTYIEFDFNQTGGSQLSGNASLIRLRMAYATLGPWLIGQTLTLFDDSLSYPDLADGALDAGMIQSGIVRKPQIRHTWLGGNGLSVAAAFEMPTYNSALGNSFGDAPDTAGATLATHATNDTATGGYQDLPRLVVAPEWDQPWGHIRFAAVIGDNQFRSTTINHESAEYAFGLTGHVNTWGKDALRVGVRYNRGAADYADDMFQGGELYNDTTGESAAVTLWSAYASYEHFFSRQWRANASLGYAHMSGNPGFTQASVLAGIEKEHFTSHLNVIYAPVPQTDFILEWIHTYRQVRSDADATSNRIDAECRFYF